MMTFRPLSLTISGIFKVAKTNNCGVLKLVISGIEICPISSVRLYPIIMQIGPHLIKSYVKACGYWMLNWVVWSHILYMLFQVST